MKKGQTPNFLRPEKAESSTTKTTTKTTTTKTALKTELKTGLKTGLKHSLPPNARAIAELMEKNPLIGIAGIAEATGLSRGGVNYLVRMLKEKAGLVRVGGRKAGHWEFKEDP